MRLKIIIISLFFFACPAKSIDQDEDYKNLKHLYHQPVYPTKTEDMDDLIQKIYNGDKKRAADIFYTLLSTNNGDSERLVKQLAILRDSRTSLMIKKYAEEFAEYNDDLFKYSKTTGYIWRDPNYIKEYIAVGEIYKNKGYPDTENFMIFSRNLLPGLTLKEMKSYLKNHKAINSDFFELHILKEKLRFNIKEFNEEVTKNYNNLYETFFTLSIFHRYDLLPEFKKAVENHPLKKAKKLSKFDKEELRFFDETIKELEYYKKIKAPIGMPLDWGEKPAKDNLYPTWETYVKETCPLCSKVDEAIK